VPNLEMKKTVWILKLLGDKTRLAIIGLLELQNWCVCDLVNIFQMSQPAISQHLRKLKDAGLINESRKGQWNYYSINKESEYYPLIKDLLKYVPSQKEQLVNIKQKND
jgi:ArsR family transcriptional regulator, arsenate/arsenite/antimonite-responsive transcriptional repressor